MGPVPVAVMPSRLEREAVGLRAMRLPPAFTQSVSAVTWVALTLTLPRTTTSKSFRLAADRFDRSTVVNSFRPSVRRISARYFEYGFAELVTTATGPPGPLSGGGGDGAAV